MAVETCVHDVMLEHRLCMPQIIPTYVDARRQRALQHVGERHGLKYCDNVASEVKGQENGSA